MAVKRATRGIKRRPPKPPPTPKPKKSTKPKKKKGPIAQHLQDILDVDKATRRKKRKK